MHAVEHPIRPDTCYSSSVQTGFFAKAMYDGMSDVAQKGEPNSTQTIWTSSNLVKLPQYAVLDLGRVYSNIEIFGYLPRQNLITPLRGLIVKYTLSVSTTDTLASSFTTVSSGTLPSTRYYKTIEFSPTNARYVKFQADSTVTDSLGFIHTDTIAAINELTVGGRTHVPYTSVVYHASTHRTAAIIGDISTFMVGGGKFTFPAAFAGKTMEVSVFNLAGRLVTKSVLKSDVLDLSKNIAAKNGVYLLKVRVMK
jgi:hypothetical protein